MRWSALTTTGTTYVVTRISGIWQRYDPPGDHPPTGASAPDLVLADGTRLGDHLHSGRALLLDLADGAGLRARAEGYGDRLEVRTSPARTGRASGRCSRGRTGSWAWAAEDEGGKGLPESLERRLGAPAVCA